MLKQKTLLLTSIIAMVMLITVIFGGCGQKPEDVPVDSSITSEVQESEVDEPAATAEPEKIPEQTQETSQPEAAEVALTTETYLSQLSQGDSFEFNFSDYNSEYKVGNRITLTIEMESTAMFNGCVGVSVGSNYEWQQEEFEFQAGQGTVTWTVTPSVDNAQLNLWFADGAPVGIISIDVTVEEVEPAVIGKLATYTEQDTFEFTFSEYNPQYQVGDLVKISVVLESDGDFNGCIGASVGKDHTWNQKEYQYNEGGRYTLTWTVKPSSDYSNIGIWWVGGTSVGIHSITVTILEEEIGIHGDYITMFTDKGNFEFAPSVINPSFKFGDKIRITVTLESDGEFTGSLGTAVGGNYEWTQTEYESDTGISTWVLDISPVIDSVQLGVWYIGGTAVGVLDIDIEIQKWGYQHEEVRGLLYTSTSKNDSYPFMPSDYCEFEDGDVITIRVELYSNDIYNGCVGVNDVNGTYRSANYNSNGGAVVCELVVAASTKEEAKIEFWWMNGKVALNSITVTKGGTIVDTNDDDTFHSGEVTKYRTASDYCKYSPGDTVTVTVELSGDGYFKGSVGMPGLEWTQSDFESSTGSKVSCTLVVPGAVSKLHDIKISIWWSEGTYVKIDNISVTAEKSGGDDDQPDEDEQMDTSSWQLAFNGFSRDWSGWNSVNGDAGKLEFSATIQDIMDINQITDISDFGGFLFQIWHVNSKYNGRTYSYKLDINGSTHREGSGTIQCSEYNSTDVVQISADDYAFSPSDTISGVITVTDKEEPGEPDDPATVITIFEGGKADESYESDDVSWLLDAEDNAVITLVYTCDDPSHAGWGVLGWGAEVDGNWIDAPSGYEADGSNATKEVTVKTTAAKLRAALGIQAGSTVTHIKLGAWSGGRIISLGISASGGTQEPDDAIYTFTYKEWQAIQDKNAAEGTNNSYTYSFSPIQYGQFADGDTVNVSVTFETDGSYFNGALGANDASGSWQDSRQIESTSNPWTWTLPNAGTNENINIQLWYMNQDVTYVKVKEIKVEKDGGTQPPDTDIFTFTYDQWKAIQDENTANGTNNSYGFSFSPSQYGQFADGDTVNISVTFETDGSYFNGALGANDASGSWQDSGQIESTSNPWTWTLPNAGTNENINIQLWYMNQDVTYVKVTDIKVEGTTTTSLYKSNNLMATGEESKHIPPADLSENEDSVNNVPTVSGNNAPEPEYKEDDISSVSGNSAP